MSEFLDASVLVEGCLTQSGKFKEADRLIASGASTSGHALAETYATLSGDRRLKIAPLDAARMVADCAENLAMGDLTHSEMLGLLRHAPGRGVRGGSFYDAIHAEVARKLGCTRIHTLNPSHFRHVAPDLEIVPL
jgi:predicted nucleic acid-binding protein